MELGEYLKGATSAEWRWGSNDCSTWPARWAGVHVEPFANEAEANERIATAGDLVALWRLTIGEQLEEVSRPLQGDIGVIRIVVAKGSPQIGAIYTGQRWAFLTPLGMAAIKTTALAIWRVPCPRP